MALILLSVAALAILAFVLREPLMAGWRRHRIARRPFPAAWRDVLRRRVPYVRGMPADLQLQLKKRIQLFLAEKQFIGCAGLDVTEEMRVTIAAQACLLVLNRRGQFFTNLQQILVYPEAFVVGKMRADAAGVLQEHRRVLLGESWSLGQVVLSWKDAADGAAVADDGQNVVIHEFAHQLDQESGHANGAPHLASRSRRERWAAVLSAEYAALQRRVGDGQPSMIGDYGAADPAEFFAVASEAFFEQPRKMADEHAALYRELSSFYRVNPLSW